MGEKIILSLCDLTGNWSQPYVDAGYDVRRIDFQTDGTDVRFLHLPQEKIHGILAAPPCTCFAVSGNRWKRSQEEMIEAISVVDACLRIILMTRPFFWALENPVGTLHRYIGKPKMYFNPCDYGDPYTKKTGLWGVFHEPEKTPVEPIRVSSQGSWVQKLGGKSERTKNLRSATPKGFAKAFFEANQ